MCSGEMNEFNGSSMEQAVADLERRSEFMDLRTLELMVSIKSNPPCDFCSYFSNGCIFFCMQFYITVKRSNIHFSPSLLRYICGKIFVKIRPVVFNVKLLTGKQTDKNAGHYITSLADVINPSIIFTE